MILSLGEAGLISTSIQAILFGCALLMFFLTIWILLQKRRHRKINYKMITAACLLVTLATAEMICNIVRICEGFISVGPNLPGGPEAYFDNYTQITFVVKSCLYNAQTLILDGVVIYRTYVVWQNMYVIIIPMLGWFGLLAASLGTNIALVTASDHSGDIFFVETGRWITAIYAATLATNLSASSLLALRIWQLNRQMASFRLQSRLSPVIRALVESGMIYSLTITAALITFVLKTPGVYVILDMISPIILIVFCMIIVRIGMANHTSLNQTTLRTSGGHPTNDAVIGSRDRNLYNMKPLAVEVMQYREVESDLGTLKDEDLLRGQRASNTHVV